ncbi:hypothetical protein ACFE04_017888 [Oxalis oulophora]
MAETSFRASSLRASSASLVGIELPILEVRYEDLKVEAEAHVGSRALPSFKNFSIGMVEGLLQTLHLRSSQKKHLDILQGISGIVQHSRLTLLLGPPGSGKTTFLLALAGRLDKELELIPIWWRWYYWLCPLAWTLYGMFASQYGDKEEMVVDVGQTVKQFLEDYYGYKHNFVGVVAVVSLAFPVMFALIFAIAIKILNFQNR